MPEVTLGAANVAIAHDKAVNLGRIRELIDEAASRRVDVLVLPEMALQGYADFAFPPGSPQSSEQKQYFEREAETIPGPSTEVVRQLVEPHGMIVQLGLAESTLHGNALFNSTALIGPKGVMGVYRKLHNPFEWNYFCAGEDTPVVDSRLGRLGSLICYDLLVPELARVYALRGVDTLLMSTAWPMKGHDRLDDYQGWALDTAATACALLNQVWLVVSNHCEKAVYSQQLDYYGSTQIVDPFGKVVARLGDEEGLAVHTADLRKTVIESRTAGLGGGNNLLRDRRPEHYGPLVDQSYRHPRASAKDVPSGEPGSDGDPGDWPPMSTQP
jgi:predicted amidohydrolase